MGLRSSEADELAGLDATEMGVLAYPDFAGATGASAAGAPRPTGAPARERSERRMKRIEAIVRPESLEVVKEALIGLGHAGLTVTEVKGHGIQKGITQHWRGQEYTIDLLPKVSIVAVVNDHEVGDVIESIVLGGAHRPHRRRQDLRLARSNRSCASGPARPGTDAL